VKKKDSNNPSHITLYKSEAKRPDIAGRVKNPVLRTRLPFLSIFG
jgi:hypothetical protein